MLSTQQSGIFVLMEAELIQRIIAAALQRGMSRSSLCRELILQALEKL